MTALSRVCDNAIYLAFATAFFVLSFLLNALCGLALLLPGHARLARPLRAALGVYFRYLLGALRFAGAVRVELPEAPRLQAGAVGRIWVMNHPSIFDGCYALAFLSNGVFVYKSAIRANPFYGAIARLANYLPNEGGPDLIREAAERLRKGEDLIIFPEGTRRSQVSPESFKPGYALIAKRAGASVHALWMENASGFLTREAPRWRPPRFPVAIRVAELGVFAPRPRENATQLADRVAERYRDQQRQVALSPLPPESGRIAPAV